MELLDMAMNDMELRHGPELATGQDLTERERRVLEAVVRTYVETAEPAGSRNVTRRFDLGVSRPRSGTP
jgi:hypothetical protein